MTGFDSKRNAAQAKLEPTQWRDMVVVSLVREGIDKHKARELADHFAAQPEQEPVAWAVQGVTQMIRGEFAELDAKSKARRIGGTCVAYPLYTTPPKRQWQGLTDEEKKTLATAAGCTEDDDGHIVMEIFRLAEIKLKEKNGH